MDVGTGLQLPANAEMGPGWTTESRKGRKRASSWRRPFCGLCVIHI